MSKVLRCGDLMPGCAMEMRGETEESVLAQAAEHAKLAHGIEELPAEMVPQVKAAIREE